MARASPYDMKLAALKQKVWQSWRFLNEWKGQLLQPERFDQEVKQFGDRRYKQTWIKALANFEALNAYNSCLDAHRLILHDFNFTPERWDYEFRDEILDAFLLFPDGLDLLKLGLEQLFTMDFSPQERENAYGLFELVARQQGRGISLPAGFIESGTGAATAA